jgi:hypothetical protein
VLGSIFETGSAAVFGARVQVFGEDNRIDRLDRVGDFHKG